MKTLPLSVFVGHRKLQRGYHAYFIPMDVRLGDVMLSANKDSPKARATAGAGWGTAQVVESINNRVKMWKVTKLQIF